jgi:hypothetical protein
VKIRIAVACGVAALSGLTLAADLTSGVEPQYIALAVGPVTSPMVTDADADCDVGTGRPGPGCC